MQTSINGKLHPVGRSYLLSAELQDSNTSSLISWGGDH